MFSQDRRFLVALFSILSFMIFAPQVVYSQTAGDEDASPRWWRGNIHTHSLWSDGDDFPEMIADWYRQHGYHFLALSDHNILSKGSKWMKESDIVARGGADALEKYQERFGTDWVQTRGEPGSPDFEVRLRPLDEFRKLVEEPDRFLMIQSEEISDRAEGVPVHMNATNLEEVIQPLGGRTVREAIRANFRAAQEQARRLDREILVHLNHPNFGYAITAEDLAAVVEERFFEVYNGHPSVAHLGKENHPGIERLWDIANTIRIAQLDAPPLLGVATDDSHDYHGQPGSHTGRGWIVVNAPQLTPEDLILAIRAGEFYASSGVALNQVGYEPKSRELSLEIAPSGDTEFTTRFIGTLRDYDSTSEPRTSDDGKPLHTTRKYSQEIGQVLDTQTGLKPTYRLTGKELYVRAVVTSNEPHHDPSFEDQKTQAWTQPVGWRTEEQ